MSQQARAVGIDLGMSYSCIAAYIDGQVKVIPNEVGQNITPSVVSFTGEQVLIGEDAKEQGAINPENTIYAIKRIIGKSFDDPSVQDYIKRWPIKVVEKGHQKVTVQATYKGEEILLVPEQVAAIMLGRLMELAETYLGCPVRDAVITVPAHFNTIQCQATKNAADMAGLNVLHVISEPAAAALAYGMEHQILSTRSINLMVFNMDEDTFDVSILKVGSGTFDVLATNGDPHLGGNKFDSLVLEHFVSLFNARNPTLNIRESPRSCSRLRAACEAARVKLFTSHNTNIEIYSLFKGRDFRSSLTRTAFEELCSDLFQRISGPISQALADAEMIAREIDEVILLGGSTRMPKIQGVIRDLFPTGTHINKCLDPELTVAHGAAIQAYNLSKEPSYNDQKINELNITSAAPLSLGLDATEGPLYTIIPYSTKLPATRSKLFTTSIINQRNINFYVYQGNKDIATENQLLGHINLEGIEIGGQGSTIIKVTFKLNVNGVLSVRVENTKSGESDDVTLMTAIDSIKPTVTENMDKVSVACSVENLSLRERIRLMKNFENYLYFIRNSAKEGGYTLRKKKFLERIFDCNIKWLIIYCKSASRDDFIKNLEKVKKMYNKVIGA